MPRLEGKIIAVTGGGSGIGRASAVIAAREGAYVVVLDQVAESAAAVVDEISGAGGNARAETCHVADSASVERAFSSIERLDGLVNSAGIARRFPLGDQDEEGWRAVIDVNLTGLYLTSRAALARMQGGASIVHISSGVALIGFRNRAAYTATKGAIVALTRNMALDYAGRGIRVNCVCPGFARTGLTRGLFADAEKRARIEAMHPLGRMGEPEDIANAVLFLLSEEASWITGIALPVDGGLSAGHLHDI